jgi:hypothetical protein
MALNITTLVDSLNNTAPVFSPIIYADIFTELELESEIVGQGADGDFVSVAISVGDVLQQHQCAFLPNNMESITATPIKQQQIMLNVSWGCNDMQKMYSQWGQQIGAYIESADPRMWKFFEHLYLTAITRRWKTELNRNIVQGVYAAPTANAVGFSLSTMDGLFKVNDDNIAAGLTVPTDTGAFTPTTIVQQLNDFVSALPIEDTADGGIIRCSYKVARMYRSAVQKMLLGGGDAKVIDYLTEHQNVKLKPYKSFGNSEKIFFKPMNFEDIVWTFNSFGEAYPTPVWEYKVLEGVIGCRAIFSRGVGFPYPKRVYCNERA